MIKYLWFHLTHRRLKPKLFQEKGDWVDNRFGNWIYWHPRLWWRNGPWRIIRICLFCPFGKHEKYMYMEHPTQEAFDKLPVAYCFYCRGKKLFR